MTAALAEARRQLRLAWPVMLTTLNWTLLHVTGIALVGLVDTREAALLAASRALTYVTIVAVLGTLSSILVFAARADGAGDQPATGQVLRDGLALALLLGVPIGAVMFFFAPALLAGLGVAPALLAGTAAVVRVMALAFPAQMIVVAGGFFLEGVSRPARATAVNLATLPLNAALVWLLATGAGGLPRLGAVGAASATLVASIAGALLMLVAARTLPDARARGLRALHDGWRHSGAGAWRLLRFGLVPGIASGLELAGFSILIGLSTQLGAATAHGFQIVFSAHNLSFTVALGLASAAGVRVGNAVGEGAPGAALSRTRVALVMTLVATALLAAPLILAPGAVAALFPASAHVHGIAAAMLALWAPFILFDAVQVVFVYALRSLGDQVAAGINSVIAYFIVTGGLGLVLIHAGAGARGLALASGLGMLLAALLQGGRFAWVSRSARAKS